MWWLDSNNKNKKTDFVLLSETRSLINNNIRVEDQPCFNKKNKKKIKPKSLRRYTAVPNLESYS